ncbi:hypothetical protein VQ7734_00092 [Vibrio quintilis]|uniref:Uncharacterized protein n=1 Tax=Vibrio quintilis TaxID=1117707 RepID=A0A1M7YP41_9VIBR|nr:hypothetical protein VQ7734_00092 [Vibrio quintilis]
MKMYRFVFDPDLTNFPPWNKFQTKEETIMSFSGDFMVFRDKTDEHGIQTYWVSALVKNMYSEFLQHYELTEVEISHESLRELGASDQFHPD